MRASDKTLLHLRRYTHETRLRAFLAFLWAGLPLLFVAGIFSAQDLQTKVTYVCNGERLVIDSCNIRDLSDSSKCMVGHPDTILSNGLMK